MELKVSKRINNKEIFVFDDILSKSALDQYYEQVKNYAFRRTELDFEGDQYPIYSCDLVPDSIEKSPIGKIVRQIMQSYFTNENQTLFRAYINQSNYGDVEYIHRDCNEQETNITALLYLNPEWDANWAGETKFYDTSREVIFSVLPHLGRLVVFRGSIEHIGSIQSRICKTSRLSLALKYKATKTETNESH